MSKNWPCMSRMRSRPGTGSSMSESAGTCTTVWPWHARLNHVWVSLTASSPLSTVLRVSYARTLETPFNENLVLSSLGCSDAVLSPLLVCSPGVSGNLEPGFRNEFHAGFQQAFGKNFVFSGDYIWKYTHNAFDFSVLGNTPSPFLSIGTIRKSPVSRCALMCRIFIT